MDRSVRLHWVKYHLEEQKKEKMNMAKKTTNLTTSLKNYRNIELRNCRYI